MPRRKSNKKKTNTSRRDTTPIDQYDPNEDSDSTLISTPISARTRGRSNIRQKLPPRVQQQLTELDDEIDQLRQDITEIDDMGVDGLTRLQADASFILNKMSTINRQIPSAQKRLQIWKSAVPSTTKDNSRAKYTQVRTYINKSIKNVAKKKLKELENEDTDDDVEVDMGEPPNPMDDIQQIQETPNEPDPVAPPVTTTPQKKPSTRKPKPKPTKSVPKFFSSSVNIELLEAKG